MMCPTKNNDVAQPSAVNHTAKLDLQLDSSKTSVSSPSKTEASTSRSTRCAVCDAETGSYHRNYGANTCLSCRAFFRRAVQGKTHSAFWCKLGTCDVTLKECRCCKKCRFEKCLKVGMKPECVMDADAIKSRFSKYIEKSKGKDKKADTMAQLATVKAKRAKVDSGSKRRRQKSSKQIDENTTVIQLEARDIRPPSLPLNTLELPIEVPSLCRDLPELETKQPLSTLSNYPLMSSYAMIPSPLALSSSPFTVSMEEIDTELPDFDLNLLPSASPRAINNPKESALSEVIPDVLQAEDDMKMLDKAKSIRNAWRNACHKERCHESLVSCIITSLSQRQSLSTMFIDGMITKYKNVFMAFANAQSEFLSLSNNDRLMLINSNAPLFVQYIFARVICSPTIGEQLQWLLLLDTPLLIENENNLRKITVCDLLTHVELQSQQEYMINSNIVSQHTSDTGKVALCCLFQTDYLNPSSQEKSQEVLKCQNLIYNYVQWSNDFYKTVSILEFKASIEALVIMVNISERNNLELENHMLLARSKSINMFKQEEDTWVQYPIHSFDFIFDQVSFGADFVKECIMHSLGVLLSKHFLLQGAKVWGSRFQQILLQHKEFTSLNCEKRSRLLAMGPPAAFAIVKAKLENCKTGSEQFSIKFGHEDEVTLNEVFNVQSRILQLKPVLLRDYIKTLHKFDAPTLERFRKLAIKLAPLLQTTDALKLMMLLAMFGSLGSEFMPHVGGVIRTYVGALKHCVGGISESTIQEALCDTRELAMILQNLSLAATTEIKTVHTSVE